MILALAILLLASCADGPDYRVVDTDVHCESFCPDEEEMRVALSKQRGMWENHGFQWPSATIYFSDRQYLGASGMKTGDSSMVVLKRGYPVWESVVDHEMGMLIMGVTNGMEDVTINKRKALGICYPDGDTGYCHD